MHHQLKRKLTGLFKNVVLLHLNLDNDKKCGIIVQGITIKSSQYWGNSMPGLSSLQVDIKKQPHNLAWINKEEQSLLKDLGGSGRPGPMGIPAYDDDDYDTDLDEDYDFDQEDISGGMGGDTGGGTGGGDSWGEPDDPNPEDFSWSASKGFTAPSVTSATTAADLQTIGVDNITDLATMEAMYNNPDAYGVGYNDFVDMGFFEKSEAADLASLREHGLSVEANARSKGLNVNITVNKDGTYNYTGPDAFTAAGSEIGKGLALASSMMGVGGLAKNISREFMPATDTNYGPSLSYNEVTRQSDRDFAESLTDFAAQNAERGSFSTPSFGDLNDREAATDLFSMQDLSSKDLTAPGAKEAIDKEETALDSSFGFLGKLASLPVEVATDIINNVANFLGKTVSEVTTKEVDTVLGKTPSTPQGEYAQGLYTKDTSFGPMTFDSRDSTMNLYQDDSEDIISIPKPVEVEKKSAMELYFERLAPSTSTAPSTAGPASTDVLSSQPNTDPEIANYAIKNNLTYQEAAKYFTPLSTITNVNTFPSAYGGGGLRGLMEYS